MIASVELLSFLVVSALVLTIATPIILIVLFIRDWKRGSQW